MPLKVCIDSDILYSCPHKEVDQNLRDQVQDPMQSISLHTQAQRQRQGGQAKAESATSIEGRGYRQEEQEAKEGVRRLA